MNDKLMTCNCGLLGMYSRQSPKEGEDIGEIEEFAPALANASGKREAKAVKA